MIPPQTAITLMTTHPVNGSTTLAFPFMDVVTVIVFFFISKRDTECYTVRNTHDCSQVYVKEATGPDTSSAMPAGSFEIEMTFDDEYQMKNA